ncbi:MAG: nicotinamide mononucleotide transporter family protein [Opitutales bacterium]|nr:nicotinamide mononucleotide transporter family protein [Opitutales bacterium]
MNRLEISASIVTAVSVILAAFNSIHTWWTGIIGCVLFGLLFFNFQLYADTTLQVFFITTCLAGWRYWLKGDQGAEAPISRSSAKTLLGDLSLALL